MIIKTVSLSKVNQVFNFAAFPGTVSTLWTPYFILLLTIFLVEYFEIKIIVFCLFETACTLVCARLFDAPFAASPCQSVGARSHVQGPATHRPHHTRVWVWPPDVRRPLVMKKASISGSLLFLLCLSFRRQSPTAPRRGGRFSHSYLCGTRGRLFRVVCVGRGQVC